MSGTLMFISMEMVAGAYLLGAQVQHADLRRHPAGPERVGGAARLGDPGHVPRPWAGGCWGSASFDPLRTEGLRKDRVMAVPSYLNTGFRYFERIGVSDVQQIIDDVEDEVLASSGLGDVAWSPWTNPSAGLYKSPVDAWNRFMDVLFTQGHAAEARDEAAQPGRGNDHDPPHHPVLVLHVDGADLQRPVPPAHRRVSWEARPARASAPAFWT